MKFAAIIPNFNSGSLVRRTVGALLQQAVPPGASLEVVVVDDGSTDDSADSIQAAFGETIRLVRLGSNRGRSTARNTGAGATDADVLIFIDSDCVPSDAGLVAGHAEAFSRGVELSFGNITTPGAGFWNALQRDTARWRLRSLREGELWTFTTQNVAVKRSAFEQSGGFDPFFDRHGFEDRDLFIKLVKRGAVVEFAPSARIVHEDAISLASVSGKMLAAGRNAAWEFDDRHPAEYSRMHFSRLDCRRRPWLRHLDRAVWPLARRLATRAEPVLETSLLPFACRACLARAVYGAHFLHGTVQRAVAQTGSSV